MLLNSIYIEAIKFDNTRNPRTINELKNYIRVEIESISVEELVKVNKFIKMMSTM